VIAATHIIISTTVAPPAVSMPTGTPNTSLHDGSVPVWPMRCSRCLRPRVASRACGGRRLHCSPTRRQRRRLPRGANAKSTDFLTQVMSLSAMEAMMLAVAARRSSLRQDLLTPGHHGDGDDIP